MDLTTAEYSFVIKCPASRHLPVRRKNSSALQGRWLEEPEGFPTHVSFRKGNKTAIMAAARETKRPLWPPQGKQKGIMAAARRTEGALRPRGCEPPSAPSGSSPCEAGQFFPSGFDCRHSGLCITQFLQFVFPDGVTPPPRMRAVPSLSRAWRHESFSRRKNQLLPRGAVLAALKYGIHPRQGRFPCRCPVFPAIAFDPLFPSEREMPRLGHFLWTFRA